MTGRAGLVTFGCLRPRSLEEGPVPAAITKTGNALASRLESEPERLEYVLRSRSVGKINSLGHGELHEILNRALNPNVISHRDLVSSDENLFHAFRDFRQTLY